MIILHGIKNCDTVKKARRWLESHHIDYQFHDYRANGINAEMMHKFSAALGWQALLNTRGTTWRTVDEARRNAITDEQSAIALMIEMPAIIKRPLLCAPGKPMLLGFNETQYQQYFNEV